MFRNNKITQQKLADKYGVTQTFVSMSILGKRNSRRARKIRREYGRALISAGNVFTNRPDKRLAA